MDPDARGGPAGPLRGPLGRRRGEWRRRTHLRDGTPVLLRQIRPEDRERLAEGLRRLSPASRYLRFHSELEAFTPAQLDYLTRVDHVDHEALVAIDPESLEVPGIGVARYVRDAHDAHVAEAAVTVADEYQGRGAGLLLLGALSSRARSNGIEVFRSYVLGGNRAMLELFDRLGATRDPETPGLWRVDLALPADERDLPDSTAGRAFVAAARHGLHLSSVHPPVWGLLRWGGQAATDVDAGIEEELTSLRDELDEWLADRERRAPDRPEDVPDDRDGA